MGIEYNEITEESTFRDLTQVVNSMGSELTKDRNVFQLVDEVRTQVKNSQLIKLTKDNGYAKDIGSISSIRELREPGTYFIPIKTLATLDDNPGISSYNVLVDVKTSFDSDYNIQNLYVTSLSQGAFQHYFRYNSKNSTTDWFKSPKFPNGKNDIRSGIDIRDLQEAGIFFVYDMTGLPSNVNSGFITVMIDTNDRRILALTDHKTGMLYHNVKDAGGDYQGWTHGITQDDVNRVSLTSPRNGKEDFNLVITSSLGKSFTQAISDYIREEGRGVFSFYCQGGVSDSPLSNSCRGMFLSSSTSNSSLHGIYYAIGTDGRFASGAVSSSSWSRPKIPAQYTELWTGSHSMNDRTSETMKDDISNYEYIKIFVKMRMTKSPTNVTDAIHNECFEFWRNGETEFNLSKVMSNPIPNSPADTFNTGVKFTGDKWKLTHYVSSVSKTQYITKIIGYNIKS